MLLNLVLRQFWVTIRNPSGPSQIGIVLFQCVEKGNLPLNQHHQATGCCLVMPAGGQSSPPIASLALVEWKLFAPDGYPYPST